MLESPPVSSIASRQLLVISLIFEGALALSYVLVNVYRETLVLPSTPTLRELLFGSMLAALLLIFNAVLIRVSFRRQWSSIINFVEEVILPLASRLSVTSAFLISVAAGVGEELFFRGLLQPEIGLLASSFLFSLTHFVFEVRKYWRLLVLYFFIGLLFGIVYELFGTLWAPVIFHILYDFCALLYFRFIFPTYRERLSSNFKPLI